MSDTDILLSVPPAAARSSDGAFPQAVFAAFDPPGRQLGSGGGHLLILAPDLAAAAGIKDALLCNPPNPRARFVAMDVSRTGMQITRS